MDKLNATRRQLIVGTAAGLTLAPAVAKAVVRPSDAASSAASDFGASLFATRAAPALSLAVATASGVAWAAAFGHVNLELGVPATASHSFPLGSVSKVLTTTAAAKLTSRGVLDLDTPISKWLPELPEQHRGTTMRQLLTHRGGIRHYNKSETDIASRGGAIYMRVYPGNADILALFINDPLVAAPGTTVNYSSYGYTLASLVMEAAAGRKFVTLIDDEVGKPLALSSLAVDDPWAVLQSRAGKYMNAADIDMLCAGLAQEARPRLTNGWASMPFGNPAYCLAGAGYLMTPSDAARFGAAMLDFAGTKLTAAERKLLFTPQTEATPNSPALGLGWRIDRDKKGRDRWHHAGATPGGRYFLAVYPGQGMSVALAGNVMSMRMNAPQAGSDLIDIFT